LISTGGGNKHTQQQSCGVPAKLELASRNFLALLLMRSERMATIRLAALLLVAAALPISSGDASLAAAVSLQELYCATTLRVRHTGFDGAFVQGDWSPCDGGEGAVFVQEASLLCQGMGFTAGRAWIECAGLIWRDHWQRFASALAAHRPDLRCPAYGPEALWRHYDPRSRPLEVLEVALGAGDYQGCSFAETYFYAPLQSPVPSVTRVNSYEDLQTLFRAADGGGFDLVHWTTGGSSSGAEWLSTALDLWRLVSVGGTLILEEGSLNDPDRPNFSYGVDEFLDRHSRDARLTRETRTASFAQLVRSIPDDMHMNHEQGATTATASALLQACVDENGNASRGEARHVHVVAVSESPTWDNRWLKYLDFLVYALPRTDSVSLTVERDVKRFPRTVELALRGGETRHQRRGDGSPCASSVPSAVVVVVGSVRSLQFQHLSALARQLQRFGAPAVGVFHLQSWRPWDFEGASALSELYSSPAFAFVRRQHFFAPLAGAAPSTPLMPAFFAEHLFEGNFFEVSAEEGGQPASTVATGDADGWRPSDSDYSLPAGAAASSRRATRCLLAVATNTDGQRAHRTAVLRVIEDRSLPCRVGAVRPGPHRVTAWVSRWAEDSEVTVIAGAGAHRDGAVADFLAEVAAADTLADAYDKPLDRSKVAAPLGGSTAYVEALRSAAVVLAPGGDEHETFRFWEALAAGAIPVTVKPEDARVDFVRNSSAFGGPHTGAPAAGASSGRQRRFGTWGHAALCPFPVLASWDQLPALLERLSGDPGYADALQRTVSRCFRELVSDVRADVGAAVDGLFEIRG